MDADVSNAENPIDMCSRIQQSEDSDDRCIILIHLFGGYSFLGEFHVRTTLDKFCMQEHSKGTRSVQIDSFIVEREC